jgi:hypothetical protein
MDWSHAAEVAVGSLPALLAIFGYIMRQERKRQRWMIEHEMIVDWYCIEHKIEKRDLPTRSKGIS